MKEKRNILFSIIYVKLQEAFASEKTELGSFKAIGYKTPGAGNGDMTTVFDYSGQNGDDVTGKWDAKARVGLNDCKMNSLWLLKAEYSQSSGNVTITVGSNAKADCIDPLTPNFCNLATNGTCTLTSL